MKAHSVVTFQSSFTNPFSENISDFSPKTFQAENRDLKGPEIKSITGRDEVPFTSKVDGSVPEMLEEGRCKATWKREFKLPWREAGPPKTSVDPDQ